MTPGTHAVKAAAHRSKSSSRQEDGGKNGLG
jgi:hypothetical protein